MMDDYIKEVANELDLKSNFLEDIGNGIFLSKKEIEILNKYNIDYKNKNSLKSILLEIEDILNEEELEDLDLISESIAERVYYNDTNK
ncbi:MAG: hypothetical protein IKG58_03140 [Bacilli bacterium]|nr:hypothetical protein [Bacilli bacterium]MBR3049533.1 hypothetical protein [Bacilli bacterium]